MIDELKQCLHKQRAVIAISGKSGCGNTTISSHLANVLDMTLINYTFRSLAEERSVSLEKIMKEAAESDEIDRHIDKRQVELTTNTCAVLASRLAIWMKKDAVFKVYLYAEKQIRVKRIQQREGWSWEKALAHTEKRDIGDHQRYLKIYGINNDDYQFADLIVDASSMNPNQVLETVLNALEKRFQ